MPLKESEMTEALTPVGQQPCSNPPCSLFALLLVLLFARTADPDSLFSTEKYKMHANKLPHAFKRSSILVDE